MLYPDQRANQEPSDVVMGLMVFSLLIFLLLLLLLFIYLFEQYNLKIVALIILEDGLLVPLATVGQAVTFSNRSFCTWGHYKGDWLRCIVHICVCILYVYMCI